MKPLTETYVTHIGCYHKTLFIPSVGYDIR